MDTGTAMGSPGWRTGPTDLLTELYSRTQLAQSQLGNLFSGQKKYFYKTSEAIVDIFDLPLDKADTLRDFAEKAVNLLDKAYPQAETKLQKLLKALESNNVKVELGPCAKKTLHVTPEGEKWYVSAHMVEDKRWLISLPIYRVSAEAEFPDLLGLSSRDLYYLQAGWRASDETSDKGKPKMGTTQPWQVFAWATVRYGYLRVYLKNLNFNKSGPTIHWVLTAKSWNQQWPTREGKKQAQQVAKRNPLGLLAWYLGDGRRHKHDLLYAVGDDEEYKPKNLIPEILQAAYYTGYGKLLDLLESEKWITLKKIKPRKQPIYATLLGHTFWLVYFYKELSARTLFKDLGEAEKLTKNLADIGLQAKVRTWQYQGRGPYYFVELDQTSVLRLAENNQEWRYALNQIAQKYRKQL